MLFNSAIKINTLSDNDIHLWRVNPQKIQDPSLLASLTELLSPEEQEKVLRYRSKEAQHTALITRAFIRIVLATYTNLTPKQLKFSIKKHGKPELFNFSEPLKFNLSHNDQVIICAVSLKRAIGCDIENTHRKINATSIARRYFSQTEYQALINLPQDKQQTRFFEYWTLKEAFVKATGKGISQGLDTFSFDINHSEKTQFNDKIKLMGKDNNSWNCYLSYHISNHCVAVCVESNHACNKPQFRFFELNNNFMAIQHKIEQP